MAHILILRFSAIGDVAMTVPVIDSLARQYPNHCYTVVSQVFLSPLFAHCPANVQFVGVNLKDYGGVMGMYRLFRELRRKRFDVVADLHDVLRTKLLRLFFHVSGTKTAHIRKGRKEKRQLTARKGKRLLPLKHVTERYADVFRALGFPVAPDFRSIFGNGRGDISAITSLTGTKSGKWIGVAPFAKHRGKIYPIERTEQIVARLTAEADVFVFLFGGGEKEKAILEEWSGKYPHTLPVAGRLKLAEELSLISHLDVMFCMDSANMHLASLTATPVVSIWGATHPYAGFYGYRQSPDNAIQLNMGCRPCSVYGNKPCFRGDEACMRGITPQTVLDYIFFPDSLPQSMKEI
ncbi:MAG: glycosyltransferase family 9 protein [Bacteroidales bacterium]|jgi:ADP-heptose:LPS heptosyltransferase|nr:glycosyltransferase family 9 protein [Bacteroidales bacterium]